MNRDQSIGIVVLVCSLIGVALYAWLIYAYPIVVLQITAFLAIAAVLLIAAWMGWTMATTPPPQPFSAETVTPSSEEKSAA